MKGEKYQQIRDIASAGLRTEIFLLEEVSPGMDWCEAEQFWIANLRFLGCRLMNLGIGGPGALGAKQSEEAIQKRLAAIGDKMKGIRRRSLESYELSVDKIRREFQTKNGKHRGIKALARTLGIPYSTLHFRLFGKATRRDRERQINLFP